MVTKTVDEWVEDTVEVWRQERHQARGEDEFNTIMTLQET